jgi:hypothetical protein
MNGCALTALVATGVLLIVFAVVFVTLGAKYGFFGARSPVPRNSPYYREAE